MSRALHCVCCLHIRVIVDLSVFPSTLSRRQTTKDVRAIIAFFNKGVTMKEIAMETGVCLRSVQRLTEQYCDTGHRCLPIAKLRTWRQNYNTKNGEHCQETSWHRALNHSKGGQVNEQRLATARIILRTLQRCIHDDVGCHRFLARRKPGLMQRQKKMRVDFCKKYKHWEPGKWQHVLWSNKALFTLTGSGGGSVPLPG